MLALTRPLVYKGIVRNQVGLYTRVEMLDNVPVFILQKSPPIAYVLTHKLSNIVEGDKVSVKFEPSPKCMRPIWTTQVCKEVQ